MAKTESKVGVGIVGCGFVAHMKHLPALKEIPEAEIVSVFDFNAGRAQEVAENFGAVGCKVCTDFEEVIRDPNVDTVYILTSNVTHSEYAVRALDAGKHVLCEKPMAMSIEEATKMMDAVERSGKKLTIGYQCRLIPEVQYLKRVCDAGELGHIYHARALAVRTATLAERTRIAREIHDNVGHMLTRAIMQTEAAHVVAQVAGQEQSAQRFCEIHDTVSEAMTLVRKAVHDLKDEGTDFASQIETAAHSMDGAGPLRVRLVNGIDSAPAAVSRCFATAIREALNNTVKHSQARNVSITLRDFPALWQLCVQDDGTVRRSSAEAVAMQFIRPNDSTGIGISDIEERARALGGSAICGPYHEGWRVFVSIPKPASGAEMTQPEKGAH